MEYTVNTLAKLSGVTPRTLRYYDRIGLLRPLRLRESGYRVYGSSEVERLRQILFYRELGVGLDEISGILASPDFDALSAMEKHLAALRTERERVDRLIGNVEKTIKVMKGNEKMSDSEKFEGFKKELISENEAKYGMEARKKYGSEAVDASNQRISGMNEEQWGSQQGLEKEIAELLRQAVATGDPSCEAAQTACDKHRQWLCGFWKKGSYSKGAHLALASTYVEDERFLAYYEAIAPGCAKFFLKAMEIYCA